MQTLCILGRQPALGLAELESLFGASGLRQIRYGQRDDGTAAVLNVDAQTVDFSRLGGSLKLCRVLTSLDTTEWRGISEHLMKLVPKLLAGTPEGKMQLGLSAYGLQVNPSTMMATGLSLKKVIKQTGRPVRLVPNKEIELNSASVLHNNLVGPSGLELVLVRDGKRTLVAQTMQVQDIDSYTVRDRERPKRDARVGMLPPKLAQIIINLAAADTDLLKGVYLLDPFCGTGVLLQEAALMGIDVYGTDLEPRMIEYSDANLQWLLTLPENRVTPHSADGKYYRLEVGDATDYTWSPVPDTVACETYLGRPFTDLPTPEVLNQTISECNLIIKKFLTNIHGQLARGTRLCLAVPAWQVRRNQFRHLPFLENQDSSALDPLRNLGYNRISFEHARNEELIYYRADQIVARELLVLQKI